MRSSPSYYGLDKKSDKVEQFGSATERDSWVSRSKYRESILHSHPRVQADRKHLNANGKPRGSPLLQVRVDSEVLAWLKQRDARAWIEKKVREEMS